MNAYWPTLTDSPISIHQQANKTSHSYNLKFKFDWTLRSSSEQIPPWFNSERTNESSDVPMHFFSGSFHSLPKCHAWLGCPLKDQEAQHIPIRDSSSERKKKAGHTKTRLFMACLFFIMKKSVPLGPLWPFGKAGLIIQKYLRSIMINTLPIAAVFVCKGPD